MKIALLGYGKMGKVIEKIALDRGHEIVLKKDRNNDFSTLADADVAIDFSIPDAAFENIKTALNHRIPVISGTTGWINKLQDIENICNDLDGAFIYGSNFSLGVNLFFELNDHLSRLMKPFSQYQTELTEIHHTQKLDAPSGTAITLANDIIKNTNYHSWTIEKPIQNDQLKIQAIREGNVPGTHIVSYHSEVDNIEIKHTAHNREGFAIGAVIAAEWIIGKKGIFTMKDVLGIHQK